MEKRIEDRMALRDIIDRYATESDKGNQDFYREIFRPDVKLKVYFYGKLGMDINNVEDMIKQYKSFGTAKISFHMNGQQVVDFIDDNNATGICYAFATLVKDNNAKDELNMFAVRYYDKYVKIDGKWWISEREQHFEYNAIPPLASN